MAKRGSDVRFLPLEGIVVVLLTTINYQNYPLVCRLPLISIQGFRIATYKRDGFGCQW